MDSLSQYVSIPDIPGHVAYVVIAVSYYLTSIFWLRVFAVIGLALEVVYFVLVSSDLYTGIAWSVIFIAINAYQLFWLLRDRLRLRLPQEEKSVLRRVLTGLDDVQISRLLDASQWRELSAGAHLMRESQEVNELYFLFSGRFGVDVGGKTVAHLESGSFAGEVAFLTGHPATASVIVEQPSRVLAISRARLIKLCKSDNQVAGVIHQLLGRDLANKLRLANGFHTMMDVAGHPRRPPDLIHLTQAATSVQDNSNRQKNV